MNIEASGALEEMGWNDAEQDDQAGRATTGALLLLVGGVYWGSVWLLSGLAPLAYLATRARRESTAHDLLWNHR